MIADRQTHTQTNTQTDRHTHHNTSLIGGGVTIKHIPKNLVTWTMYLNLLSSVTAQWIQCNCYQKVAKTVTFQLVLYWPRPYSIVKSVMQRTGICPFIHLCVCPVLFPTLMWVLGHYASSDSPGESNSGERGQRILQPYCPTTPARHRWHTE